jgi:hypothetical protein
MEGKANLRRDCVEELQNCDRRPPLQKKEDARKRVPCILALRSGGGKTERLRDHRVPGSKREAETVWSQIRSRYVFV